MKLQTAAHRAIYFWAGPGTIRMNLLKYDRPINRAEHLLAYRQEGVKRLKRMGINVVYAAFDWGFAPEVEKEDWDCFQEFSRLCHRSGIELFAYVQSSNMVWKEWFERHPESASWLCRDRNGNPVPYAQFGNIRYRCCYSNPAWRAHLKDVVRTALGHGADGIFFDNIHFLPCYCASCQEGFRKFLANRKVNPLELEKIQGGPADPNYRLWREFHCHVTARVFREMRAFIKSIKAEAPMTGNTYDIVNGNKILEHGFDPSEILKIQDLALIENPTLPRMVGDREVNNARTIAVARAMTPGKLVSVVSFAPRGGLGSLYTSMYAPEEFQLAIAEASACQAALVVKGTEYFCREWTLLTDASYEAQREAIGAYHRFLSRHRALYEGTKSLATLALLYHQESLTWDRERAFPSFCGFCQTLHQKSIPFRIVTEENVKQGRFARATLVVLPQTSRVGSDELESLLWHVQGGGKLLITGEFATGHFGHREGFARPRERLLKHRNVTYLRDCPGWIDLSHAHWRESYHHFRLPPRHQHISELVKRLSPPPIEVESSLRESVFAWRKRDEIVLHFVNYDRKEPHTARVRFPAAIAQVKGYSPDSSVRNRVEVQGRSLTVRDTEVYDVVVATLVQR